MAEEVSTPAPKVKKATNEGIGQPTSKSKAKTSQIEKQCLCTKISRSLLCPSHGEKKWLNRK